MTMNTKTNSNNDKSIIGTPDGDIPLLEVNSLKKYFLVEHGFIDRVFSRKEEFVHAVDDVSFQINHGEIFCLVGESGCGKTTTARIVAGLETKTSGEFKWNGVKIDDKDLKPRKGMVKSQIVFQNPYSSLNPRMKLGEAVLQPLIIHNDVKDEETINKLNLAKIGELILLITSLLSVLSYIMTYLSSNVGLFTFLTAILLAFGFSSYFYLARIKRNQVENPQVLELYKKVGLFPPNQYYDKYPHAVSGGERQRAAIARAIILNPKLLVLDEPTSMLDVSLRAGILDLLRELQQKEDISILFITHDLATARHFGDRVGVMYVGQLVEVGSVDDLFKSPLHPYTKALVEAIPSAIISDEKYDLPKGEVADAINPPTGCRFHPRCSYAKDICSEKVPVLTNLKPNQSVACHFPLVD